MKCCDMTSGMLRTPVQFERLIEIRDHETAGVSEVWEPLVSTRGHFRFLSGNERLHAGRMEAGVTARIVTRYFSVPPIPDVDGGTPDTADVAYDGDVDGGAPATVAYVGDVDGGPAWDIPSGPLTERDRAVIGGRAYNIRFINNLELRNRWLEIDLAGGVAL